MRRKLHDIVPGNNFLDMTSKAQAIYIFLKKWN